MSSAFRLAVFAMLAEGCLGMSELSGQDAAEVRAADAGEIDAGAQPPDAGAPAKDAGGTVSEVSFDAGSGDFFGASRCQAGQYSVCEDFEAATFNPALWAYYPSGGTGYAAVDATRAARGNHSLHFHSGAQLHAREKWPFLTSGFFLRAFMYWGQSLPDWHLTYFWVIAPNDGAFTLGSYHDQLGINEFGPRNGDTGVAARDQLPVGRWVCVEWQVAPATNEVHAWMDEAEVPSEPANPFQVPTMHVTNWPAMQWNEFTLEFITARPSDDLWMDELAIDSKRIGCRR
jgi:hypothetical protein